MAAEDQEQVMSTAAQSSLLNNTFDWDPNHLFDEDECRDFLNAVGDVVVNSYIFSIGMEETYSCIWYRYDHDGTSDAISLLHGILEEEDVVGAGLGLDSDIWRPWKKNFRLRNINPQNPWVPHVGTRYLPPATPPEIRKLRAQNFLRCPDGSFQITKRRYETAFSNPISDRKGVSRLTLDGAGGMQTRIPAYAHQRYRAHFQLEDGLEESPPGTWIGRSDSGHIKRLSSVASQRPTISSKSSTSNVRPHSAQVETPTLDPAVARAWLSLTAAQRDTTAKTFEADQPHTLQPVRYVPGSEDAESIPTSSQQSIREEAVLSESERRTPDPEDSDQSLDGPAANRDIDATQEIQYVHRNATLLAGEIRTPVSADHRNHVSDNPDNATKKGDPELLRSVVQESKEESVPSPAQQCEKRKSRTARFLSVFGIGEKKQRGSLSDSRRSFSIKSSRSSLCFLQPGKRSPAEVDDRARARPMPIAAIFDGPSSPKSKISSGHLNKPLPLSPGERAQSASARANSSSPRRMEYRPPLKASSVSTETTYASSKDQFRHTTQELLQGDMLFTPKLPMNEDGSRSPAATLEPRKYEPLNISSPWLANMAHSNPYTDMPVFLSKENDAHDDAAQTISASHDGDIPPVPTMPASYPEPNHNLDSAQLPLPGHYGPLPFHQESTVRSNERSAPRQHQFVAPPQATSSSNHGRSVPRQYGFSTPSQATSPSRERSAPRRGELSTPSQATSISPERSFVIDEPRGRPETRTQRPQTEDESSPRRKASKPAKRSQSPIKRLLGFGKNTPSKDPKPAHANKIEPTPGSNAKRSLRDWSYKIKHGFLASEQAEQERENHMEDYNASKPALSVQPPSTFPISLDPSYQARLQADLELMIVITANRFLMKEAQADRLPRYKVDKFRRHWESRNLAQVIEYQFDMATQRAIILDNIETLTFSGEIADNPLLHAATFQAWGSMIYEMQVRTFCVGDSVIRKWLNDAQRILEMLGAPYITFSMFDKMSTKALLVINHRQRLARARDADESNSATPDVGDKNRQHTRNISDSSYVFRPQVHKRSISNDSYVHGLYGSMEAQLEALDASLHGAPHALDAGSSSRGGSRQTSGAQSQHMQWDVITPAPSVGSQAYEAIRTLPRDAYEESRGGRLGLMRNATPAPGNDSFARQSPSRMGVREV